MEEVGTQSGCSRCGGTQSHAVNCSRNIIKAFDGTPWVVAAAIQDGDGTIVLGPRHFDLTMGRTLHLIGRQMALAEQGFVDQYGEFMTREKAWEAAWINGQIRRRVSGDGGSKDGKGKLFSENLY